MSNAAGITVRVPLVIRRRGGRKLVVTADGATVRDAAPARTRADPALVKAPARAHRWKRLLESGRYGSLAELAAAEKIDRYYLAGTLRLTLLAPDIVEAILDGRQSCDLALIRHVGLGTHDVPPLSSGAAMVSPSGARGAGST